MGVFSEGVIQFRIELLKAGNSQGKSIVSWEDESLEPEAKSCAHGLGIFT